MNIYISTQACAVCGSSVGLVLLGTHVTIEACIESLTERRALMRLAIEQAAAQLERKNEIAVVNQRDQRL